MILSILIPTYNRSSDLKSNLNMLKEYIINGGWQNEVSLIISNNYSSDDTENVIKDFKASNNDIIVDHYFQDDNIGLERNALFTLEKASSEYIMYLGDDDYIEFDYLRRVLEIIKGVRSVSAIFPAFIPISPNGEKLLGGRDLHEPSKYYKKGFKNCLLNSNKGHQLSGLVFKRKGLLNSYVENKVQNIYPFIYFSAYSCINGDSYHLTDYPILVTQPGQENKDWNYGNDGLLNEIFDNYNKLQVNYLKKSLLQYYFFDKQRWRLFRYLRIGNKVFNKAFKSILFSENSTYAFRFLFLLRVLFTYSKIKLLQKPKVDKY